MNSIRDILFNKFQDQDFSLEISNLITSLIMIAAWLLIGIISTIIIKYVLFKLFKIKSRGARALTIGKLFSSMTKYVIWFIISMIILSELQIDVTPFIASAGMIGLIIGFGAQEVVKDFISGFFIIFEESFNVGDMIQVDGFKGVVLELGLRTTRIKNWKDEVKIIRNGDIDSLINFSKEDSIAVIDFGVSYNTDLVKFPKLMDKFIKSIDGKYDNIIEKPQFLGVVELDNSSINMRVIAKTVAVKHFQIERDIRSDLVIFCSSNNIEIPFPQLVIHNE
jgi:small conductance mechanosensitive channel